MASRDDDAKVRVQAALLILLQEGKTLRNIGANPMSRDFQLGCKRDKVGRLIDEIFEDAELKDILIKHLLKQFNGEAVPDVSRGKQVEREKKPRKQTKAEPKVVKTQSHQGEAPLTVNKHAEPEQWEPRIVEGDGKKSLGQMSSISDVGRGSLACESEQPSKAQILVASSSSRKNDNGSSLEEAMCELTDVFHTFSTSEPSLADVKAVTRYLRSATKMAGARAAS